jgi:hypothetical protein
LARRAKKPLPLWEGWFIEVNDWEGETWNFYIPVAGNEEAVALLKEQLARVVAVDTNHESEHPYSISDKLRTSSQITTLTRFDDHCSYMAGHNLLEGTLTLPPFPKGLTQKTAQDWEGQFYKGGITNFISLRQRNEH